MQKDSNSEELKEKQINIIYELIKKEPSGILITSLETTLNSKFSINLKRRTLLRRLEFMKSRGQIITHGRGNKIYYQAAEGQPNSIPLQGYTFSPDTEKTLTYVNQPISKRKPVGYNFDFLNSYIPGETFYLSTSLREQLKTMGEPTFRQPKEQKSLIGTHARNIYNRLLVDLSWASSHLEGNTYSRLDTLNLIDFGQVAAGKDLKETQMILNHKAAIETLVENRDRIGFDSFTIFTLHANLAYNLIPNALDSGRLRQGPIEISGTTYLPMAIPDYIQSTFHTLLKKASEISDPYEQSFFIMVHLPYLQPFIDVNKRVSRLAANIPFLRHDLCPLSFIDVEEKTYMDGLIAIYELNSVDILKEVYTWAYERSCQRYRGVVQSMAEPDPLRLRYRELIISVVKTIVGHMEKPTTGAINKALRKHSYDPIDREALQEMILEEFTTLHEGNIGRYGLTLSQYYKWKA